MARTRTLRYAAVAAALILAVMAFASTHAQEPEPYPGPLLTQKSPGQLTVSIEINLPATTQLDVGASAWDDRDRAAGFQPDWFVWYDADLSTRLTVNYGHNGCVEGSVVLTNTYHRVYSWHSSHSWMRAMSPTPRVDIDNLLEGAQQNLTDLAGDIADLCNNSSWWVSSVEHTLQVYTIPTDKIYYGNVSMPYPETGERVSFLDWLWKTMDNHDQMVDHLWSVVTYPDAFKTEGQAGWRAYFLARELLFRYPPTNTTRD